MDKDNKSKIKLSTLVILFILIVIIIGGIIFVVLNNNNSNTVLEGKTTQQPEKTQENTQVEPQPDPQTESPTPNQYADTDFSFKFLKMENKKENMLYSPLSIKYALKMLNDGANLRLKM